MIVVRSRHKDNIYKPLCQFRGIVDSSNFFQMDPNNIQVFVRVRPPNEKEENHGLCIDGIHENSIRVKDSSSNGAINRFSFDGIFPMDSRQVDVFQRVGNILVDSVFEGINGTAFTYGQTSSGKTYTCMGPDIESPEHRGLIPRLIEQVFKRISQGCSDIEYKLKVSLVEIYQQRVRDLLDTNKTDLKIRENKGRGIYIQDVTETYVACKTDVIKLIQQGSHNRALGHTNMNEASSRSHMVFILTVHQDNNRDLSAKSAKLTLVDLAGSQKIAKTGAEGKLLDQAKHINKSLSALGNVINALTDTKGGHIPYRDSKLTRILQESLGGNAKTNLIINISPSILNDAETITTLRFGTRAKNIKNKPKINKQYTVPELLLLLQKAETKIQEMQATIKKLSEGERLSSLAIQTKARQSRKTERDSSVDSMDDDQPRPSNMKLIENYVSPLAEEYSQNGVTLQPQSNLNIDIKLLEMEVGSLKKKAVRTKNQQKKLQKQNTQLSREVVLLNERYKNCIQELDDLHQQHDQLVQENSVLYEKYSSGEQLLSKLKEENSQLQSSIQGYQEIQQQVKNVKKAEARSSQMVRLYGNFRASFQSSSSPMPKLLRIPSSPNKTESQDQSFVEEQTDKMKKKLEELQAELNKYQNLQTEKQRLDQDRADFQKQKGSLLGDLENRIFKVIELEQQLDFQRSKRQHLQETIAMEEKAKVSKITQLQSFISQLTASYYLLKNQQLCWKTEARIYENTMKRKTNQIEQLQREAQLLKNQLEQMGGRPLTDATNMQYSESKIKIQRPSERTESHIVKVVKPRGSKTTNGLNSPKQPSLLISNLDSEGESKENLVSIRLQ